MINNMTKKSHDSELYKAYARWTAVLNKFLSHNDWLYINNILDEYYAHFGNRISQRKAFGRDLLIFKSLGYLFKQTQVRTHWLFRFNKEKSDISKALVNPQITNAIYAALTINQALHPLSKQITLNNLFTNPNHLKTAEIPTNLSEQSHLTPVELTLNKLTTCLTAIRQGMALEFEYFSLSNPQKTLRHVFPSNLDVFADSWYLQGYDLEKRAWRVYKLERIGDNIKIIYTNKRNLKPAHDIFTNWTDTLPQLSIPSKQGFSKAIKRLQQTTHVFPTWPSSPTNSHLSAYQLEQMNIQRILLMLKLISKKPGITIKELAQATGNVNHPGRVMNLLNRLSKFGTNKPFDKTYLRLQLPPHSTSKTRLTNAQTQVFLENEVYDLSSFSPAKVRVLSTDQVAILLHTLYQLHHLQTLDITFPNSDFPAAINVLRATCLLPTRDFSLSHNTFSSHSSLSYAITNHTPVNLVYCTSNHTSERKILPRKLVSKNDRIYIQAYCFERKANRNFRIDCVKHLSLSTDLPVNKEFLATLPQLQSPNPSERDNTTHICLAFTPKNFALCRHYLEDMLAQVCYDFLSDTSLIYVRITYFERSWMLHKMQYLLDKIYALDDTTFIHDIVHIQ